MECTSLNSTMPCMLSKLRNQNHRHIAELYSTDFHGSLVTDLVSHLFNSRFNTILCTRDLRGNTIGDLSSGIFAGLPNMKILYGVACTIGILHSQPTAFVLQGFECQQNCINCQRRLFRTEQADDSVSHGVCADMFATSCTLLISQTAGWEST